MKIFSLEVPPPPLPLFPLSNYPPPYENPIVNHHNFSPRLIMLLRLKSLEMATSE